MPAAARVHSKAWQHILNLAHNTQGSSIQVFGCSWNSNSSEHHSFIDVARAPVALSLSYMSKPEQRCRGNHVSVLDSRVESIGCCKLRLDTIEIRAEL